MITRHPSLYEVPADPRMSSADYADGLGPSGPGKTILVITRGRLFRDSIRSVLESPGRVILSHYESLTEIPNMVPPPELFVVGVGEADDPAETFAHIRRLRGTAANCKWLILTDRADPQFLAQATECGVDWLLPEDSPSEVLQFLTNLILVGKTASPTRLSPLVTGGPRQLAEPSRADSPVPPRSPAMPPRIVHPAPPAPVSPTSAMSDPRASVGGPREGGVEVRVERRQIDLSEREKEILSCLVTGMSNKLIARKLSIAEATVKAHVKGLLRKMQVANRTQAAILALNILAMQPVQPDKSESSDGT